MQPGLKPILQCNSKTVVRESILCKAERKYYVKH